LTSKWTVIVQEIPGMLLFAAEGAVQALQEQALRASTTLTKLRWEGIDMMRVSLKRQSSIAIERQFQAVNARMIF